MIDEIPGIALNDDCPLHPDAPPAATVPDVGDWIGYVYWKPSPFHDHPEMGSWQIDSGRVVAVGKNGQVMYESNTTVPTIDEMAIQGSRLRVVPGDRVYTPDNAERAALLLPRK